MLIGDIIISSRELMPDLPGTLTPPGIGTLTPINDPSGAIAPGTYFVKLTTLCPWGETSPSTELSVTIAPGQNAFTVTWGAPGGQFYIGTNVYIGTTSGQENRVLRSTNLSGTLNVLNLNVDQSVVPLRNSAFLPDTNGRMVSVGTLYRWLNEALNVASYVCKGIPDVSGVQMISGQGFYTLPGIWDKLENCWYDGFPVAFDARSGAFYRNKLSGIVFIGILQTNSDRMILELQPQPSRSGGSTTLSSSVGISDTTIPLTSIAQMGLSLGMVQVGTEIISYGSLSGGSLAGCSRGLGGTQQSAWPAGTAVKELNFRFGGLRLNQQIQYAPGQALTTLQVPPGWAPALVDYLIGRFREAEQNSQGKGESIKAFTSFLKDYNRGTKQTAGPRQVGGSTPAGDGYSSASSGGRLIIP